MKTHYKAYCIGNLSINNTCNIVLLFDELSTQYFYIKALEIAITFFDFYYIFEV